ncbi:MAG: DUF6090 family protein [Verrucomicrobia bacterium]|nr:DUF6090 family protein [Verrucomicrobiota bacterium]
MFRFFRRIRQKLFLEGRVSRYFGYAIGEIALIVVGILIALYISDWNQAKKDHTEETAILIELKTEFDENQERLAYNRSEHRFTSETMRSFLKLIKPEPESVSDELIHRYMASLQFLPTYKPNTKVLNSLISSGKIALIKNKTLNNNLSNWPTAMEEYKNYTTLIVESLKLQMPGLYAYHQFKDSMINVGEKRTSTIPPEKLSHAGPSNFRYDQETLLSLPSLENAVEFKRVNSDMVLLIIEDLSAIQQEILDLIDAELAERDVGGEDPASR